MSSKVLGLMSGTSLDGLSIALCSFPPKKSFRFHAYKTYPYPKKIRKCLLNASQLKTNELSQLHFELGHFYSKKTSDFLKKNKISSSQVKVIGSHGQTVYHGASDPTPNTLQIGEASLIAEETGIPVVCDFRVRDLASGGQGAPLIPFFDHDYFAHTKGRALQNIGGIANVSFVKKGKPTLAFDNGPGNTLIDWAMRKTTKGKKTYDSNGSVAKRGRIDFELVYEMASDPYFSKTPPKSTGPELFNESWLPKRLLNKRAEDLIATITFLTAYTIYQSYIFFAPFEIKEVIVSGGGALNKTLMSHLKQLLKPANVKSISEWGFPVQAKEPIAFAYFAFKALEGQTNHAPSVTGARNNCILGKIIPGTLKRQNKKYAHS